MEYKLIISRKLFFSFFFFQVFLKSALELGYVLL